MCWRQKQRNLRPWTESVSLHSSLSNLQGPMFLHHFSKKHRIYLNVKNPPHLVLKTSSHVHTETPAARPARCFLPPTRLHQHLPRKQGRMHNKQQGHGWDHAGPQVTLRWENLLVRLLHKRNKSTSGCKRLIPSICLMSINSQHKFV